MIPISLYIHIPFCFNKCPYCAFLSFTDYKNINIKKYILNMIKDLKEDFFFKNDKRYIYSIYIGGGTPNILSLNNIYFLLENIFLNFLCKKNIEITLEVNILNLNINNIFWYSKIGINRLSIGVQSFDNHVLKNIERNYTYSDILNIIYNVKCYFNNFNIDLIYGLPNQSVNSAIKDIKNVIELNIPHLSWYELIIQKNTKYYNFLNKINYSKIEEIFFLGKKILKKHGYFQYEISSYVKKKKRVCFHNINYWRFGDYLGIGCGAHSKITTSNYSIYRTIKNKNFKNYITGSYISKRYILSIKDIIIEYFICRLRLLTSFCIKKFIFYTGLKFSFIKFKVDLAIKKKYLIYIDRKKHFSLTKKGFLFLNDCLEIFI